MGNVCCFKKKNKRKVVLLLLGLDNAGKTVAAKGLAGEPIDNVLPTVGFHQVKLSYRDFTVKVYDLGGSANFRGLWPKYYVDAFGIIFVLDSSDVERLNEAKEVLESVLSNNKVSGKPLLFLANKQDDENALDEVDLHEKLNLEELVNTYQCPTLIECCTATNKNTKIDSGITQGFHWLMDFINENFEELNTRVIDDTIAQQEYEHKIRQEIAQNIKKAQRKEKRDEDAIELYSEYTKKLNKENQNGKCNNNLCLPVHSSNPSAISMERPQSAREFVKDQLKLYCNGVSLRKNKTMPLRLKEAKYPSSARERSKTCELPRRILKSAGNFPVHFQLPNMTFDDKADFGNPNFIPLEITPKVRIQNGICNDKSEDDGDLEIIDVD